MAGGRSIFCGMHSIIRVLIVLVLACAASTGAAVATNADRPEPGGTGAEPARKPPLGLDPATSDVRNHGAQLDGVADDSEALRRAFTAVGPAGKIVVPPGGRLRLARTVTMNLEGGRGFSLVCESPVVADPGIGNAIEVINGYPKFIDAFFLGGGRLADYRLADPEGADQALYLRGIRGGEIKVKASGYKGRVIRVTKELPGEPKTSMLFFSSIETVPSLDIKDCCGQAWYMDGSSAFGMIGRAWVFWDCYGPIFNGVHDLTINDIEGGWRGGTRGLRFEGCSAVHIGKLALGDETQTVDLLTFTMNANRKRWHNINVEEAFLLKGRRGVVIEHSDDEGYIRGHFYSKITKEPAMTVTDVKKFDLQLVSYKDGSGVIVQGNGTRLGRLDLMVTDPLREGAVVPAREDLMLQGFIARLETNAPAAVAQERSGEILTLRELALPQFVPTSKISAFGGQK